MLGAGGLGDGEERREAHEEAERDLARRCAMRGGDLLQQRPAGRARAGKISMTERAVGDHGGAVLLAPRNDAVLDGALAQMVEDLVAGRMLVAGDRAHLVEIGHVEVADAPGEYLSFALQLLEGGDRVGERMAAAPVQEVAIQPVGAEPGQRILAGRQRSPPRGIVRQHLGNQEDLIAPAADCLADDLLGEARTVHLGGIDMRHAEIGASAPGGDRPLPIDRLDVPGTLADDGDVAIRGAEPSQFHGYPPRQRIRSTILPSTCPAARRSCALAASASGYSAAMWTLSFAAATARFSCSNSRYPALAS